MNTWLELAVCVFMCVLCSYLQQWRESRLEEPHHADSVAPPWASGPSNGRSSHRTALTPGSPPAVVALHHPGPEYELRLTVSVSSLFAGLAACKASSGSYWPPAGGSHRLSQSASESRVLLHHPERSESAHWGSSVGSECAASRHRLKFGVWQARGPAILLRYDRAPVPRNLSANCWKERWPCWSRRAQGSGHTPLTLRGSDSQTHLMWYR